MRCSPCCAGSNGREMTSDLGRRKFIGATGAALAVPWEHQIVEERRMYGLIGKMTSLSGEREALIAILLENAAAMPGCLSYVVARDFADPEGIWLTEVWDNQESHRASLSLPGVKQAIVRGKPLIAGFGERVVTEPVG